MKRRVRRERSLRQSESRWLQKAMFALSKARDAREKLAELREEPVEPMHVDVDGEAFDIENVRGGVQGRIDFLRAALQESRALVR